MTGGVFSRAWRRRTWLGLQTLFGFAPRGFFLPYRYADRLPGPGQRRAYEAIEARFRALEAEFETQLAAAENYIAELRLLNGPPPVPRWDQDWFPRLDAAIAYSQVRARGPARIVEVGSGHSTRFLARAVADQGLETAITAIDPSPRADLRGLPVDFLSESVTQAGLAPFAALQSGDFLVIDSSHLLMPGSDVDFLFGHVLPGLDAGVLVHIHDIFLPDDYPADWAWRGYNEQLGVLPMICGTDWQVRFSSRYVVTRMSERLAASPLGGLPLSTGAWESSLWIEKCR